MDKVMRRRVRLYVEVDVNVNGLITSTGLYGVEELVATTVKAELAAASWAVEAEVVYLPPMMAADKRTWASEDKPIANEERAQLMKIVKVLRKRPDPDFDDRLDMADRIEMIAKPIVVTHPKVD